MKIQRTNGIFKSSQQKAKLLSSLKTNKLAPSRARQATYGPLVLHSATHSLATTRLETRDQKAWTTLTSEHGNLPGIKDLIAADKIQDMFPAPHQQTARELLDTLCSATANNSIYEKLRQTQVQGVLEGLICRNTNSVLDCLPGVNPNVDRAKTAIVEQLQELSDLPVTLSDLSKPEFRSLLETIHLEKLKVQYPNALANTKIEQELKEQIQAVTELDIYTSPIKNVQDYNDEETLITHKDLLVRELQSTFTEFAQKSAEQIQIQDPGSNRGLIIPPGANFSQVQPVESLTNSHALYGVEAHRGNFANMILTAGINWSGADLRDSNFMQTSFLGCVIQDLKAWKSNFSRSKMQDANLRALEANNSDFQLAEITRTNLTYAKFGHAKLEEAKLEQVDLSSADLSDANLAGSQFTEVDLSNSKLHKTKAGLGWSGNLSKVSAAFIGLLKKSKPASFTGVSFEGASLRLADLSGCKITACNFKNADLIGANLAHIKDWQSMIEVDNLQDSPFLGCFYSTDSRMPKALKKHLEQVGYGYTPSIKEGNSRFYNLTNSPSISTERSHEPQQQLKINLYTGDNERNH